MGNLNDKRRTIMEAALRVIANKGFHGATTSKIAKLAGVAEGTIYNYFENKEDLIISLFEETWRKLTERAETRISNLEHPNDKLEAIFDEVMGLFEKNPHLIEVFLIEIKPGSLFYEKKVQSLLSFLDLIEGIIREGQSLRIYKRDLDPKATRMVIFGAAQGIIHGAFLEGAESFSLKAAKETLKRILKSGLMEEIQSGL
ncbi:MAG: TetR/AcrR family transcriptional regulator [Actinomycetota bacterium]|nr:TetR/AcrR family transcriptional regulator [Actinomycetota bacterium]